VGFFMPMKRLFFQNESLWSVVVGKLKKAVELAAFSGSEPPKVVRFPVLYGGFSHDVARVCWRGCWRAAAHLLPLRTSDGIGRSEGVEWSALSVPWITK
jgi:hypothetical protein